MVNMSKKFTGWEERTLLQQMVFDELDICTEKNKASTQYQIILRTEKILGENHCDLGIESVYIYIYIRFYQNLKMFAFPKTPLRKQCYILQKIHNTNMSNYLCEKYIKNSFFKQMCLAMAGIF